MEAPPLSPTLWLGACGALQRRQKACARPCFQRDGLVICALAASTQSRVTGQPTQLQPAQGGARGRFQDGLSPLWGWAGGTLSWASPAGWANSFPSLRFPPPVRVLPPQLLGAWRSASREGGQEPWGSMYIFIFSKCKLHDRLHMSQCPLLPPPAPLSRQPASATLGGQVGGQFRAGEGIPALMLCLQLPEWLLGPPAQLGVRYLWPLVLRGCLTRSPQELPPWGPGGLGRAERSYFPQGWGGRQPLATPPPRHHSQPDPGCVGGSLADVSPPPPQFLCAQQPPHLHSPCQL